MRAKTPYNKKRKRVGCGIGSGHGKRSCRGQKGQGSRSGSSTRSGFEGGQNPLYRRLPKRGFNNAAFQKTYRVVNLELISSLGESEVTPETLMNRGVIKSIKDGLKILGNGELKKPLVIKAHAFSESAKEKIQKAGGQAVLLNTR